VKQREYYDSVRLMRTAEMIRRQEGVQEAMLVMATESNKQLLEAAGLPTGEAAEATPNDLVIAIVAESEEAAERAMQEAERLLKERAAAGERHVYRTLASALGTMPGGNLALISVPGEYAAAEARRALESGLHVMLFSDNVSLEDEVSLKGLAQEKGLLMMVFMGRHRRGLGHGDPSAERPHRPPGSRRLARYRRGQPRPLAGGQRGDDAGGDRVAGGRPGNRGIGADLEAARPRG